MLGPSPLLKLQVISADLVYDRTRNVVYRVADGSVRWQGPNLATETAVAGLLAVFPRDGRLVAVRY